MTMRVSGPGGVVVNFPDGTDEGTIGKVMSQAMAQSQGQDMGKDITPNNVVRSMGNGIPVIGGMLNSIDAATNATLAPVLNPLFSQDNQLQGGWSDRYKQSLAQQNGMDSGYWQNHPVADLAGNLAGGTLATVAAAGMLPPGSGATTLSGKIAQGGAVGAGLGGADSAVRSGGDMKSAAIGAGVGGITGMAAPAVTTGIGKIAQAVLGQKAVAPTVEQIAQKADEGYAAAKNAGLQFSPEAWNNTVNDIGNQAKEQFGMGSPMANLTDEVYGKAPSFVQKLQQSAGQSPTLQDVELMKRAASGIASAPESSAPGSMIASKLRGAINNATPEDFIAGDVQGGISGIQQGRQNWQILQKAQQIQEALRQADIRGSANYSQAGEEQALKRQFTKIATDSDFKKMWTPEEQQAILDVIDGGSKATGALRWLGKMAPTGGLSSSLNLLLTSIAPHIGIPVAAVSTGAKAITSGGTAAKAAIVDAIVRNGGVAPQVRQVVSPTAQRLMNALLIGSGAQVAGRVPGVMLSQPQ